MLRILFTFAGGSGHLEPLVPLAQAAESAGHTVAFAGRPWMLPQVEALGFSAFASGSDAGLTPRRRPLVAIDMEREMRDVGEGFGRRIARERAADVLALCAAWRPDLLVCEELDFGPMIVAERLRLPCATVLVNASGAFVRPDVVAGPLNEVRAEYGLEPDPELAMPGRHLVLSSFPLGFRDPAAPWPATAHALRLFSRAAGCAAAREAGLATGRAARPAGARPAGLAAARDEPTPAWLALLGERPVVYVTLGTVFNMESGDLFQRVLTGLRELPVELVVTVGRDLDPAELDPQPANVHIERYVPQAMLLPCCRLVVSHGGSGSVLGALAHGLPMVLLPLGADQPFNAARCETLGVARVLDAVGATQRTVREAVTGVLDDPAYRRAAEVFRDEIDALPGPQHAVRLLEGLAPAH